MSRATVKVVSIVIAGALLVGIVLAAVGPATRSGPGATTTAPATVAVSTDPETNVRNACVDWAKVGKGSDGSMSAAEIGATLAEMATLADVAAAGNPTAYNAFAKSVHDMEIAFRSNDATTVSASIAAINPVCVVRH